MTERDSVKAKEMPSVVGIVTSLSGLKVAARVANPPDLLELRLDHLTDVLDQVEEMIPCLRSPLVITVRDFREGGAKRLSLRERRELLRRFLPHAAYVDIELRSWRTLAAIFKAAHRQRVRRILSVHYFDSTPDLRAMLVKAGQAKSAGAEVFKIVTRVDKADQLARLVEFMKRRPANIKVCAMGFGRLGVTSRIILSRLGSAMTYSHLGRATLEGQPSLSQIRRLLRQGLGEESAHPTVSAPFI